jgi:hypothetical protein
VTKAAHAAEVGDLIVITGHYVGESERIAEILEVVDDRRMSGTACAGTTATRACTSRAATRRSTPRVHRRYGEAMTL